MKEFNMNERVYMFYISRLSRHVELREVVELVMILSHRNIRVESGFSAMRNCYLKICQKVHF